MTDSWPAAADGPLVDVLRALPFPAASAFTGHGVEALFTRAELHGVAGVVHDAGVAQGVALPARLADLLRARLIAREIDHGAHLAMLGRVDIALRTAGLRGVVLKGPLFAERYYGRPSARATSDIDLLVTEDTLEAAADALVSVGYRISDDPREEWYRREHHHLHLENPHALPLELHFHAYRGFGSTMRSDPLLARSRPAKDASLTALAVLEPADEVVYLAVHAAAHRFVRLGWLYDLVLVVAAMSDADLHEARARAHQTGYGRALAFAAELLREVFGVERAVLLGRLDAVRRPLVHGVAREPASPVLRSATRFVYTTSLCDSPRAAARYATRAALQRAWLLFGVTA